MDTIIPQKRCYKCAQELPATLEFFYSNKQAKDGLHSRCKRCWKVDRKPRYIPPEGQKHCPGCGNDLPATLEYFYPTASIYRSSGMNTYCRDCHHPKRLAAWDRKLIREDKVRRPRRKGEGIDIEARKAYEKRWFQNGGNDIVKANTRNRRARLKQAQGHHTAKDIKVQYQRQKGKCYYCSRLLNGSYHVDHIVPVTRGGSNDPSNLVVTCSTCNEKKSNKLPHEWPEGNRLL